METYRIHTDASVYYVTYSVVQWLPVFVTEDACQIVTDSLAWCHTHKGLRINAYVIMPTHMHAIFFDHQFDSARLAATLAAFRRHSGKALCEYAASHLPPCFSRTLANSARTDRRRQFWQHTRHPIGLASKSLWEQKLQYLHDNPRRKGLVRYPEDWRFFSARHYLHGKDEGQEVTISPIDWP